jgi:hypothetical protein
MKDVPLSSVGGAAQGGSAKPKEERDSVERQQPGRDDKGVPSGSAQESGVTPNAPQSGIDDGPGDSSGADGGD